jgi:hypothetical protein
VALTKGHNVMTRAEISSLYNERKEGIMADLKKSREDLRLFQRCKLKFGKAWEETINLEKEWFNSRKQDLIKLKKWWGKHG